MPNGAYQDGLWGQVAVWPPKPCPGGLGARSASALSPLVAAGSHGLLWDARRRGQSLDGVLPPLAGLPAGVVPARAQARGRAGALILPKAWCDWRGGQRVGAAEGEPHRLTRRAAIKIIF